MKSKLSLFFAGASIVLFALPFNIFAATTKALPFQYSVWLPFWKSQDGATDISLHLDSLNEINPFSYELDAQGNILDDLNINNGSWNAWFSSVEELHVKIVPTIAYFDPKGIYGLLSNSASRQKEEDAVMNLVKTNNFDGIDIDFESMAPATRPYYSLFIQGLAQRLHPAGKTLDCTIVPRTPADSLYASGTAPTKISYPENYTVLGTYCDEVRLMAYDQGPIDLKLDASKGSSGQFYAPVADPDWVKKVIAQATPYMNPKKIMLGIPSYGYEYEVSWVDNEITYTRVRSFSYLQAMDRLDSLGITSTRDSATGELTFMYTSSTYIYQPPVLTSYVSSTEPFALQALNGGNQGGSGSTTLFYTSFPDAQSMANEIALAKKLGLRGVALFKADGMQDPLTWNVMTH
jgi:spore germination protein YaaH